MTTKNKNGGREECNRSRRPIYEQQQLFDQKGRILLSVEGCSLSAGPFVVLLEGSIIHVESSTQAITAQAYSRLAGLTIVGVIFFHCSATHDAEHPAVATNELLLAFVVLFWILTV